MCKRVCRGGCKKERKRRGVDEVNTVREYVRGRGMRYEEMADVFLVKRAAYVLMSRVMGV